MIEVESKVRISDLNDIRKRSRALGRFIGKHRKVDDYYTLENVKNYPKKSLRIRHLDGHYQVNFKSRGPYKDGVYAKKEVEFIVSDIKGFLALIDDFGFKKWIRKEKETELYEIEKNLHIEINNVKGLGWFAEIEYLAKPEEVNRARRKVVEVFKRLGLNEKKAIKDGYTKLLWNKRH